MNYVEKYGKPEVQFSPRPDVEVEAGILRTGRKYPCFVCKEITEFHKSYEDMPSIPCCSDECKVILDEVSPISSMVEHSLDMGVVDGSTPSLGTEEPHERSVGNAQYEQVPESNPDS